MDTQNSISTNTPKIKPSTKRRSFVRAISEKHRTFFQAENFHKDLFYGEVDCTFSKHSEVFFARTRKVFFSRTENAKTKKNSTKKTLFSSNCSQEHVEFSFVNPAETLHRKAEKISLAVRKKLGKTIFTIKSFIKSFNRTSKIRF